MEGEEFGHGSRHDGSDVVGDRNFGKFPKNGIDNRRRQIAPVTTVTQSYLLIVMQDDKVFVSLTHEPLEPTKVMDLVRSHEAGAIVLFAGTTRDNFAGNPTITLELTPKARQ